MDLLKKSIEELAVNFTARMDEFQKEVRTSVPEASPSNFSAQFQIFRSFVMTALENLQLQLQLLSRQQDDMEARTRRKMLLVHGVPETSGENPARGVSKLLSERLSLPVPINVDSISKCHRLGRLSSDKPRAILVKFRDQDLRDRIWFGKSKLKGSGVTISEFMTKCRHEAFVAARKRFGVSQCWTRDGYIVVLSPDGVRHKVVSVAEVNAISEPANVTPGPSGLAGVSGTPKNNVTIRARKPYRK